MAGKAEDELSSPALSSARNMTANLFRRVRQKADGSEYGSRHVPDAASAVPAMTRQIWSRFPISCR